MSYDIEDTGSNAGRTAMSGMGASDTGASDIGAGDTERLRSEMERTRQDLSDNVNRLGATVSPGNIADRQKAKVSRTVHDWKDRVMGAGEDARDATMDKAHDLSDNLTGSAQSAAHGAEGTAHDLSVKARQKTQGNPLAVGLIALGAGWLLGSMLPASEKEREAATRLKEEAQPMLEQATAELKEAGSEMAEHLKPQAEQAVQEVKSAASDSAQTVTGEAKSSTDDLRTEAQRAADDLRS